IDKFGNSAIVISKYIYGLRLAMCVFYGVGRMPFPRFLALSSLSCGIWVIMLAGTGYFFSGAITSIIGDYKRMGVALFIVVMVGVLDFYDMQRYWRSERVEAAHAEALELIEEQF